MTSLKQTMRSLLTEVEKFLVETLKGVKLKDNAKDEKDRILEKVRQLLDEIPGSASSQLDNSFASGGSHKTSGGGDSGGGSASGSFTAAAGDDEGAYNDDIAKIAVSDLKNKLQSGLLDKRKKTAAVLKTWDPVYCVVSQNIFYIYKKQSDTKQKEAFCLTGYEFHEAPGLEKDASKKEACFELTKAGAATYQFRAGSKDGMIHWREAITKGIQMGPDEEEPGETYEDVGQDGDSKEEMFEDPDDIYEECGPDSVEEKRPPQPPPPVVRPPPPRPEPQPEAPDELYDDATSTADLDKKKDDDKAAAAPPPLPPGNRRPPPLPPSSDNPPNLPPKADLPAIPKEIPPPPIPERRPSAADAPPLPANPPPLPGRGGGVQPVRVPQLRKPFMDRDEDFENIFYGKWDCEADSSKELSFKQGDMIHVLSRDFDAESWWVGELEGKIGLVPKDFLHPAFILVA